MVLKFFFNFPTSTLKPFANLASFSDVMKHKAFAPESPTDLAPETFHARKYPFKRTSEDGCAPFVFASILASSKTSHSRKHRSKSSHVSPHNDGYLAKAMNASAMACAIGNACTE